MLRHRRRKFESWNNASKQVGLRLNFHWPARGREMKMLMAAVLPRGALEQRKQRSLCGVLAVGGELYIEKRADFDAGRYGGQRDWRAIREREERALIVELLYTVWSSSQAQLLRKTIGTRCPLKGKRCENACHGVVGMAGQAAIRAEGEQHLRANTSNPLHQFADYRVQLR